jgi:transposase
VGGGKHYAPKIKRAQILLAADSGLSDDDIAAAVGGSTVYRTKRRFVEVNLEAALNQEPRAGADRKLTSNEEALLVATACSSPREGRARWTLELLAGAMIKLTDHDSLSRETVRRRLAENHLKPRQKDMWCIDTSAMREIERSDAPSTSMVNDPGAGLCIKLVLARTFMLRGSRNTPSASPL